MSGCGEAEWKVFYGRNFWESEKGGEPSREIRLGKKFLWGGHEWEAAAVYVCEKGLTLDLCKRVEQKEMRRFLNRWLAGGEKETELTDAELDQAGEEHPLRWDIRLSLQVDGRPVRMESSCTACINPCALLYGADEIGDQEALHAAAHYGLDGDACWMIARSHFAWDRETDALPLVLELTLSEEKKTVRAERFCVSEKGVRKQIVHPGTGRTYLLTVEAFSQDSLAEDLFSGMDIPEERFPRCFIQMTYRLEPELSDDEFRLRDCSSSDELTTAGGGTSAAGIAVIGGADGPVSFFVAGKTGEKTALVHRAFSSLHFEPVREVCWQPVFWEQRTEDMVLTIECG